MLKIAKFFTISMVIVLFFPALQSSPPAEAIRSSSSSSSFSVISSRSSPPPHGFFYRKAMHFKKNVGEENNPRKEVCNPSFVHVAMTLDVEFLRGTIASVHSILQNSLSPENIFFHFIYSDTEDNLHSLIEDIFPSIRFKDYYFNPEIVQNKISSSVREALEQPLNYARNYLAQLIEPCVGRVIYLDSDVVLVDNLSKLWEISLKSATLESLNGIFVRLISTLLYWLRQAMPMDDGFLRSESVAIFPSTASHPFPDCSTGNGSYIKEDPIELAKRDRGYRIMENFAKALWVVLKQYKERLEVYWWLCLSTLITM